jgi:hypothetical protein
VARPDANGGGQARWDTRPRSWAAADSASSAVAQSGGVIRDGQRPERLDDALERHLQLVHRSAERVRDDQGQRRPDDRDEDAG